MKSGHEHSFRRAKISARQVSALQRAFVEQQGPFLSAWQERVRHRRIVENDLARRLYGAEPLTAEVRKSIEILGRQDKTRPYFLYDYSFSCESIGPPTAHTHGALGADVTGHVGTASKPFPGKSMHLWTGSSDAWRDESGADADAFRNPFCELVVSGSEYYTLQYTCHADGDSGSSFIGGWYSVAYVRLHCRVPFIVVEEW